MIAKRMLTYFHDEVENFEIDWCPAKKPGAAKCVQSENLRHV